jgi:two-component system sensor histidine kinase/response regulator
VEHHLKLGKPVADLSGITAAANNDQALVEELIEVFIDSYPSQLDDISRAIDSKDPGQLQMAAHALKGVVSNFGASAAYDLALRLETMGREGTLDGAEEVFDALKKEMNRIEQYLKNNIAP